MCHHQKDRATRHISTCMHVYICIYIYIFNLSCYKAYGLLSGQRVVFKTFLVKPKGFLPGFFGLKTTMGFTFHIRRSWHTVGTFEGETVWELLTVCHLNDQNWMDTLLKLTHSP